MTKPIIEVKNLGKKYNIAHRRGGYIALRDVLTTVFRNPFAFAKQKTKQIVGLETKEEFWALKDINLEINPGEVVGIIGHNGSGKSTLLKILSQITPPTTGEIKIRGRVGSLLEVGTGFHPELTGRENIFLNAAILGMPRAELIKKFDEIVEFSGIGKFLDTPVKYYSSGMYVRLAFSVAAHLEPDILLVDEVLAVGDAEFQKKCLGKMDEVTKKEGRTILFVSHNMGAIQQLCHRGIVLDSGKIKYFGNTQKAIEKYLRDDTTNNKPINRRIDRQGSGTLKFSGFKAQTLDGKNYLETGKPFKISVDLEKRPPERTLENVAISFSFKNPVNNENLLVFWTETSGSNFKIDRDKTTIECLIKYCPLVYGQYGVNLYCTINEAMSDYVVDAATIIVNDTEYFSGGRRDHESHPKYVVGHEWSIKS